MKKTLLFTSAALLTAAATFTTVNSQDNEMSFFITSEGLGDGASLGGLDGADAIAPHRPVQPAPGAKRGAPI